jgi:hypothetical protein
MPSTRGGDGAIPGERQTELKIIGIIQMSWPAR